MSNYNLYLDDFRDPIDSSYYKQQPIYSALNWVVVRNFNEFISYIQNNGIPSIVSLDHDIYYEEYDNPEKTGYDCAEWLINHCKTNGLDLPDKIYIHSGNPVGSENIRNIFKLNNKNVEI